MKVATKSGAVDEAGKRSETIDVHRVEICNDDGELLLVIKQPGKHRFEVMGVAFRCEGLAIIPRSSNLCEIQLTPLNWTMADE